MKQPNFAAPVGIAVTPLERPETWRDSEARWEMVVPKMVRSDRGSKALPTALIVDNPNRDVYPPILTPTSTSFDKARTPLLSRAFAAIGRRTRLLVAGPAKTAIPLWSRLDSPGFALANGGATHSQVLQLTAPAPSISADNPIAQQDGIKERHAGRELLLSKITSTLRSHSQSSDAGLKTSRPAERWSDVPIANKPGSLYRL